MGSDRYCRARDRVWCTRRVCRWVPRKNFQLRLGWGCFLLRVWYDPRRGYTPAELLRTTVAGEQLRYVFATVEFPMKKKSVAAPAPGEGPKHLAAVESNVFSRLPSLVAHCCVTRYDDGDPRKPGWFTVKTMGSAWVCQVKDPDSAASFTATSNTLDDALALADLLLSSEEAPWEPDPFLKKMEAGKKK